VLALALILILILIHALALILEPSEWFPQCVVFEGAARTGPHHKTKLRSSPKQDHMHRIVIRIVSDSAAVRIDSDYGTPIATHRKLDTDGADADVVVRVNWLSHPRG
jgi:hypothetical protein